MFWSDYPPPRQLSRASRAAIAGGAKGIIFEQYSTNSLDTQVVCQGHLPCVVVDRESIFTIQSSDRYLLVIIFVCLQLHATCYSSFINLG